MCIGIRKIHINIKYNSQRKFYNIGIISQYSSRQELAAIMYVDHQVVNRIVLLYDLNDRNTNRM